MFEYRSKGLLNCGQPWVCVSVRAPVCVCLCVQVCMCVRGGGFPGVGVGVWWVCWMPDISYGERCSTPRAGRGAVQQPAGTQAFFSA